MPAKIITLSQKDQDLLRNALDAAHIGIIDGSTVHLMSVTTDLAARIKDLKERIL